MKIYQPRSQAISSHGPRPRRKRGGGREMKEPGNEVEDLLADLFLAQGKGWGALGNLVGCFFPEDLCFFFTNVPISYDETLTKTCAKFLINGSMPQIPYSLQINAYMSILASFYMLQSDLACVLYYYWHTHWAGSSLQMTLVISP